jgi:hypothetical protein
VVVGTLGSLKDWRTHPGWARRRRSVPPARPGRDPAPMGLAQSRLGAGKGLLVELGSEAAGG